MRHVGDPSLGAIYLGKQRCLFRVWAPKSAHVRVRLLGDDQRLVSLEADERGYHQAVLDGVSPGAKYMFVLDSDKQRPDPASRFQPEGVHGPSQVVANDFSWDERGWCGLQLEDYILYELHIGTFTPEGTFDAAIDKLDHLVDLGVTAVELMPVAQFSGDRNWGYDGVYPYAPHASYGGPEGLKRFVQACHRRGIAVVLDVVYNHLGPEGNYLGDYGPYFSKKYRTPWGAAINFDDAYNHEVRRYFIENALMWVTDYHMDALRIDAVHAIFDSSPRTFLEELTEAVHRRGQRLGRRVFLFAESENNDPRLVLPNCQGGFEMDGVWADDLHHSVHALLTGERNGYYEDFGDFELLASALRGGWAFSGQYSRFRKRPHGRSPRNVRASQIITSMQNHDQIGNRADGARLSRLVSFESLKLAAGFVLLSPYLPMLFMGEEYGERAPFWYFTSHLDSALAESVRRGRKKDMAAFRWSSKPADPQDPDTFLACKLHWDEIDEERHQVLLRYYRELIRLRKKIPALRALDKRRTEVLSFSQEKVLVVRRWVHPYDRDGRDRAYGTTSVVGREAITVMNFSEEEVVVDMPMTRGTWRLLIDSSSSMWSEPLPTRGLVNRPSQHGPPSLRETFFSHGTVTVHRRPRSVACYALEEQD